MGFALLASEVKPSWDTEWELELNLFSMNYVFVLSTAGYLCFSVVLKVIGLLEHGPNHMLLCPFEPCPHNFNIQAGPTHSLAPKGSPPPTT